MKGQFLLSFNRYFTCTMIFIYLFFIGQCFFSFLAKQYFWGDKKKYYVPLIKMFQYRFIFHVHLGIVGKFV